VQQLIAAIYENSHAALKVLDHAVARWYRGSSPRKKEGVMATVALASVSKAPLPFKTHAKTNSVIISLEICGLLLLVVIKPTQTLGIERAQHDMISHKQRVRRLPQRELRIDATSHNISSVAAVFAS
jgi:hypothetical protein